MRFSVSRFRPFPLLFFSVNSASSALRGYLLSLIATVLWSTGFPLARVLPVTVSPAELAFWRWLFTFLLMLPFGIRAFVSEWHLIRQNLKWIIPAGILGFAGYSLLMFAAARTTGATNMALFASTAPISMAVLARFILKEKLSFYQVAGLAIAVIGVVVLVLRGDFAHLAAMHFTVGDFWMLLAATLFSVYSILIRNRPPLLQQKALMTALLASGFVSLIPLMGAEVFSGSYVLPETKMFVVMIAIALVPTLAGYYFWNRAVEHIGAARAGIVYYSIPFFSSLEAVFFLGEPVNFFQAAGGILIIGGILLSSLNVLKTLWRKNG